MPLPLGHISVGLVAHELSTKNATAGFWWKTALFVGVLANLPDIDVVVGLLVEANGWAFHRGPTHSALFALFAAVIASRAWKVSSRFPRLGFFGCFSVLLSHVFSDMLFTTSPVSLLWPLEVNWASGHLGWNDVSGAVCRDTLNDIDVIVLSSVLLVWIRVVKKGGTRFSKIPERWLLHLYNRASR